MKKLTENQISHLIEKTINQPKKNQIKNTKIYEFYSKKWNNCITKKERFEFLDEFFLTRKKLIREGYRSSTNEGILGSLFSGGLGGFKSTFKEWIARKLVSALSIEDADLKNAIAISIANLDWTEDWTKLMAPIKNCEYFSGIIAHSIVEYYVKKKSTEWFGDGVFANTLRNAIVDNLRNVENAKKLEEAIGSIVCPAFRKLFGGESVKDTIKSVMGGETKTGTPNAEPAI